MGLPACWAWLAQVAAPHACHPVPSGSCMPSLRSGAGAPERVRPCCHWERTPRWARAAGGAPRKGRRCRRWGRGTWVHERTGGAAPRGAAHRVDLARSARRRQPPFGTHHAFRYEKEPSFCRETRIATQLISSTARSRLYMVPAGGHKNQRGGVSCPSGAVKRWLCQSNSFSRSKPTRKLDRPSERGGLNACNPADPLMHDAWCCGCQSSKFGRRRVAPGFARCFGSLRTARAVKTINSSIYSLVGRN
jgi:hypothetical protein